MAKVVEFAPDVEPRKGFPFKTLADLAAEGTVQKQWLIKGIFARGEDIGVGGVRPDR